MVPVSTQRTTALHCSRRLRRLHDTAALLLADDQLLLAEGVITAYCGLASRSALMKLEDAYRGESGAVNTPLQALHDKIKRLMKLPVPNEVAGVRPISHAGGVPLKDALQLLSEIDVAIAHCEGEITAAEQVHLATPTSALYPPYPARRDSPPLSNGGRGGFSETLPVDKKWNDSSCVRHDLYKKSTSPSPSTNLDDAWDRGSCRTERVYGTRLGSVCWAGVDCGCGECVNVAREICAKSRRDKQLLWHMRCIVEEVVRRYTILVEERVYLITLLVASREELAVRCSTVSECSSATRHAKLVREENTHLATNAVESLKRPQEIKTESTYIDCLVGAGEGEAVVKTKAPKALTSGRMYVQLLRLAQAHLCDAEAAQRASILREAQISAKFLYINLQLALAHTNNWSRTDIGKRLEQELAQIVHEIACSSARAERSLTVCTPFQHEECKVPSTGRPFPSMRSGTPFTAHCLLSQSPSPAATQRGTQHSQPHLCSPSRDDVPVRLFAFCTPSTIGVSDVTPLAGSSPEKVSSTHFFSASCGVLPYDSPPFSERMTSATSYPTVSLPTPTPKRGPLSQQRRGQDVGDWNVKDVTLHICMQLEDVKRKHIAMRENHARKKLIPLFWATTPSGE
ncbi:hypothetical protein ERJ75_000878200 [Trypanosoma vivax]|nr:hypothetical protein TRVL_06375 [Trypanosoma vivax]KAH8612564.1 hypothetical protein ERJ75_000878200 [Trypanosoma vivax]